MKLSIPVAETIQKRHSVRTYENKPLLSQDRDALLECMKQLDNPFGAPVHTYIIDQKLNAEGEKLGHTASLREQARSSGFLSRIRSWHPWRLGMNLKTSSCLPLIGGWGRCGWQRPSIEMASLPRWEFRRMNCFWQFRR